jgi:hypothetical protein
MDFPDNSNSRYAILPVAPSPKPAIDSSAAAGLPAGIPNCAVPDGATALVGIVGMGAIGRVVARRLQALMRICFTLIAAICLRSMNGTESFIYGD